jgi:hypothetical protein
MIYKRGNYLMEYGVNEFIKHFNHMKNKSQIEDILNLNEENPFWITARELLSKKDYKLLKEEIVGKERKSKIRAKRRNIKYWNS